MERLFFHFVLSISKTSMSNQEDSKFAEDSFLTISQESSGLFKDRSSKFHFYAFPVKTEEDVKKYVLGLRKTHYDARHHCFAYVLGRNADHFRAVDDGEPNHSAGDPILGQIRSFQITNTLIVVVRYFGGTKLGMSGLINAYKTSAQMALEGNEIIREFIFEEVRIKFLYPKMNEVMKLVKQWDLQIIDQEMHLDCQMTLSYKESLKLELIENLEEIGDLEILKD